MKILVANLGSTSFKYRLFEMSDSESELLTQGGFERVTEFVPCIEEMLETLVGDGIIQSINLTSAFPKYDDFQDNEKQQQG